MAVLENVNYHTDHRTMASPFIVFNNLKNKNSYFYSPIKNFNKTKQFSFINPSMEESKSIQSNPLLEDVKAPNLFERVKEEIVAVMHTEKIYSKETHGTSDDIDENTPNNEVRAPNIFERAKEEIEAIVQTIHPKKEINQNSLLKEDKGFWVFLGKWFDKCCSAGSRKGGLES